VVAYTAQTWGAWLANQRIAVRARQTHAGVVALVVDATGVGLLPTGTAVLIALGVIAKNISVTLAARYKGTDVTGF